MMPARRAAPVIIMTQYLAHRLSAKPSPPGEVSQRVDPVRAKTQATGARAAPGSKNSRLRFARTTERLFPPGDKRLPNREPPRARQQDSDREKPRKIRASSVAAQRRRPTTARPLERRRLPFPAHECARAMPTAAVAPPPGLQACRTTPSR